MRFLNNKEWAEAKEAAAKLRKQYRSAFPREALPLKIGIHDDIVADGRFTAREAKLALAYYVGTPRYLKACARPGAMRHDLNGNPVEPVTPSQAAYAADPHGRSRAAQPNRGSSKVCNPVGLKTRAHPNFCAVGLDFRRDRS